MRCVGGWSATHPGTGRRRRGSERAFDVIQAWLAKPCATVVHPGARHPALLRQLLGSLGAAGNLVSDAHLAALAIEHGAE